MHSVLRKQCARVLPLLSSTFWDRHLLAEPLIQKMLARFYPCFTQQFLCPCDWLVSHCGKCEIANLQPGGPLSVVLLDRPEGDTRHFVGRCGNCLDLKLLAGIEHSGIDE